MPEVGVGGLNKEHYLLVPWGGGDKFILAPCGIPQRV